jgi:hypothetical protein
MTIGATGTGVSTRRCGIGRDGVTTNGGWGVGNTAVSGAGVTTGVYLGVTVRGGKGSLARFDQFARASEQASRNDS